MPFANDNDLLIHCMHFLIWLECSDMLLVICEAGQPDTDAFAFARLLVPAEIRLCENNDLCNARRVDDVCNLGAHDVLVKSVTPG